MLDIDDGTKLITVPPKRLRIPDSLRAFLNKRGPTPPVANDLRRFPRFYYPCSAVATNGEMLPAFPRELGRVVVVTKDLSRTGISLLHTDQIYPGETLRLWLPCGEKQLLVIRCEQKADDCFEAAGFFV